MKINSFAIVVEFAICNAIALFFILAQQTTTAYAVENNQPNINATNLYETHNMVLNNNVKNLLILIPNEAHEPYSLKEQQLINQPFIPQHVRMNLGTTIVFFNADVGHDHREVTTKGQTGTQVFDTQIFSYDDDKSDKIPNSSHNYTFNEIGDFLYHDTVFGQKIMNGTIQVVGIPSQQQTDINNNNNNSLTTNYPNYPQYDFDTVGAFIVPTEMLNKYTTSFENQGLEIYDIHNFKNLMDKDEANNSLIVLTSNGHTLKSVIEKLQKITTTLPYS